MFKNFIACETFECAYLGPTSNGHRWKLTNLVTGHQHFTYGTDDEVREMCTRQAAAWKRRMKTMGMVGSAWRGSRNYSAMKKPSADAKA